jgi:hypothetical protein
MKDSLITIDKINSHFELRAYTTYRDFYLFFNNTRKAFSFFFKLKWGHFRTALKANYQAEKVNEPVSGSNYPSAKNPHNTSLIWYFILRICSQRKQMFFLNFCFIFYRLLNTTAVYCFVWVTKHWRPPGCKVLFTLSVSTVKLNEIPLWNTI